MNLGAFAWAARARQLSGTSRITGWQGLARSHPLLAAGFTVCLVSLAGLPPTGGFIAKWYVFLALVEQIRLSWDPFLLLLLVAGVLNTLISFIYYLRIPAQMVFREAPPAGWKPARGTGLAAAGTALAALSLLSGMAGFDMLLDALAAWLWN
jgi:NADH-quinone oxidoreductase subunit N